MKIPNKVKIAGIIYKIIKIKELALDSGLAGEHIGHKCEIKLQGTGYDPQKIEQSFWHETLHGINDHYINNELTERQIDNLASGIFQVLHDNNLLKK